MLYKYEEKNYKILRSYSQDVTANIEYILLVFIYKCVRC